GQVGGAEWVGGAAQEGAVLEAGGENDGQQHEVAAGGAGHQEGGDRHLAQVEALGPHHRREGATDDGERLDVEGGVVEQRLGVLVAADRGGERGHVACLSV